MKKFGDYGFAPIHCETKMGGAEVKNWLYKVNGVLYPHKFDYVCPALLKRTKEDLRVALIDFYNAKVPSIAQKKKEEILQKGKVFYLKMKELENNFKWEPADAEDVQKVLRYWVAAYLKLKPKMTMKDAVALLQSSKQAYADYYEDASKYIALDQVSTETFKSMQNELTCYVHQSLGI